MIKFEAKGKLEIYDEEGSLIGRSSVAFEDNEYLYATVPVKNSTALPLRQNQEVGVSYFSDVKVFVFETQVIGSMVDNVVVYKMKMPDRYEVVQRREYVRQNVNVPLLYKIDGEERLFDSFTEDISGSGISFRVSEYIKPGTLIEFSIQSMDLFIDAQGQVIHIKEDVVRRGHYIAGLKFTSILEKDRESIISFVFKAMRHQIRHTRRDIR